jgi:hypothetical protein
MRSLRRLARNTAACEAAVQILLGALSAIYLLAARNVPPLTALLAEAALTALLVANALGDPRIHAPTDLIVTPVLAARTLFSLAILMPLSLDPAIRAALDRADPGVRRRVLHRAMIETAGVMLQLCRIAPVRDGRSRERPPSPHIALRSPSSGNPADAVALRGEPKARRRADFVGPPRRPSRLFHHSLPFAPSARRPSR